MYIHVDSKESEREEGWRADICLRCEEIASCQAVRTLNTVRVYFIPVGRSTVATRLICSRCGAAFPCDLRGLALIPAEPASLAELIDLTNPQVESRQERRRTRAERLARGQLEGEERIEWMVETLIRCALGEDKKLKSAHPDGPAWGAIGLAVGATALVVALLAMGSGAMNGPSGGGLGAAVVVAWVMAALVSAGAPKRYAARRILPQAVPVLRALDPSLSELKKVRRRLRAMRAPIGKAMQPRQMFLQLNARPSDALQRP